MAAVNVVADSVMVKMINIAIYYVTPVKKIITGRLKAIYTEARQVSRKQYELKGK